MRRADSVSRAALGIGGRAVGLCTLLVAATARADPPPITHPPPTPPPAPAPIPELIPPRLVEAGTVAYPEGAQGDAVVTLTLVVNRDGTVRSAEATRGDEPFASAAVAAARSFRFEPATRGGQALAATIHFEVRFEAPTPSPDVTSPNSANTPNATNGSATSPNGAATSPPPKNQTTTSSGPSLSNNEVVVTGNRPAPGVTSMTRAEVRQLPGAFGDPFRALDAMPGVTPIISGLPYFYVRGAPPGNVGYFLDGVRVPYLFHVGLGPSIVNPAMVDSVVLYPGGYPARYGRFAGGIVSGETTAPRTDAHGEGNVRVFDLGGVVETGFAGGRGTVLLGGRYSYTAAAVSLISPSTELDYRDYQARVSFDITPHDRVSTFAFGSYDLLGQKQPQGLRILFGTEFYRLDTRYDHFYGDGNSIRFAVTLGYDQTRIDVDRNAQDKMLGARFELNHHLSSHVLLRGGMDGTVDAYTSTSSSYVDPADPTVIAVNALFPPRNDYAFGAWADVVADVTPGLEVTPGVRVDVFESNGVTKPAVDVRLAGKVRVTDRLKLIEAFGLAHQPPAFVVPVPGLTPGTLANGLQSALQASAGTEFQLPAQITATTTLFYNAFFNMNDDLGTNQTNVTNLDQRSLGEAYGFELYAHRALTSKLGGFVTYTLSRSTRSLGNEHFVSAFDRTHVGNVALAYDLGRNWRAGARFMFYTGVPKRPDIPPGLIQPPRTTSTEREPGFYRLDVRVEKRWNLKGTTWISLVFEMLNATFHKETVSNTQIGPVTIPSIGVEAGF
jgi:TonB family protein